jgi:hypothetical protein
MLHLRRPAGPAKVIAAAALTAALVVAAQFGTAGASTASDRAQAKKHLLVLSDMPSGWKAEAGSGGGGSSDFPGAKQLASCIGVPSSLITSNPPQANSPYFQNASMSLEVQDTVSVFPSVQKARAEFAAIANAKTPACMTTIMNGTFKSKISGSAGKGATVGTITVTRINPANFGKGIAGMVMSLPITSEGVSITANITAVYYIKGNLGQQIDFNSYGTSFPTAIAKALTTVAIHRL